ncbi:unnamed protein product [Adineta ricciae]|uniref:NAD(P)(+)--arginine ADP-ribosyltransferase n=1 Tax=Adineta ricciae TaxID=249248 RepID=A0A813ULL0_ADIRI|nr:unnamed protein product [Adineta ricciae]CAF1499544.1 unnamed protein product [Adineta ricciae]
MDDQSQSAVNSSGGQEVNYNGNESGQPPSTSTNLRGGRHMQNRLLVWLDVNADKSKDENRDFLTCFRRVINEIYIFRQADQCIDFLNEHKDAQIFCVVSDDIDQKIISKIHYMSQIHTIFVFCQNKADHEQWTKNWSKIRGVFIEIEGLCKSMQQAVQQCDEDSISMSFVSATVQSTSPESLDRLDPTFMYTQSFKEILLEIDYDDEGAVEELTTYCRDQYSDDKHVLEKIAQFKQEYRHHKPIWWYTYEKFLYRMLNQALRNLEVETILKMAFFIRDLHRQIEQLYLKQFHDRQSPNVLVYRGQGMTTRDFDILKRSQGGLLAFNNFLSTSKSPEFAKRFACGSLWNPDLEGIFFEMVIDLAVSTTPFADLGNISCSPSEKEVLFSMHTVFRIGAVEPMNNGNRLWRVHLDLTADNDTQLSALAASDREKNSNFTGWDRLGNLLMRLGETGKYEQMYRSLLNQPSKDEKRANAYLNLAGRKLTTDPNYKDAIIFLSKAREIYEEQQLPSIHPIFGLIHNGIGLAHMHLNEPLKAHPFLEKSLEVNKRIFLDHHTSLSLSYKSMATVSSMLGEYSQAISFEEKILECREKFLPTIHPELAFGYLSIAITYIHHSEFEKARTSAEKALTIFEELYSSDDDGLATAYKGLGDLSSYMNDYPKALSFYEKAFKICRANFPLTHGIFASYYASLGDLYKRMGNFSGAFSAYEKTLEINKANLRLNDLLLSIDYNRIGILHHYVGEYTKALSCYEKAFEIEQKARSAHYTILTGTQNNFGLVYLELGEYSKACIFFEKAIEIQQKASSIDYFTVGFFHLMLGLTKTFLGEHPKAVEFCERGLELQRRACSPNHIQFATSYMLMGMVYKQMDDHSKAVFYFDKMLKRLENFPVVEQKHVSYVHNMIGEIYLKKGDYSAALQSFEKAVELVQKLLPENHPYFAEYYNNIGEVYQNTKRYDKALSSFQQAVEIGQHKLPSNHTKLQKWRSNLESLKKSVC